MKQLFIILFTVLVLSALGQQVAPVSHFSLDPYFYNPAAAGSNTQLEAAMGYRNQWLGLKNSPKTYFANAHKALHVTQINSLISKKKYLKGHVQHQEMFTKKKTSRYLLKHAGGINISADQAGAFRRTAVGLTYALHLPFESFSIAIGSTFGYGNFKFDQTKVTLLEEFDVTYEAYLLQGATTSFMNLTTGCYFYSDHFYFGYATDQLLSSKLKSNTNDATLGLNAHHYIGLGGGIDATEKLEVKPNLLLSKVEGLPVNWHFNTLGNYEKTYEFGLGYRTQDAVTIQAGYMHDEKYKFSYAYDITLSALNRFSTGSHELIFVLKLP